MGKKRYRSQRTNSRSSEDREHAAIDFYEQLYDDHGGGGDSSRWQDDAPFGERTRSNNRRSRRRRSSKRTGHGERGPSRHDWGEAG